MNTSAVSPPVGLVVEDEPLILMETADVLRDAGFSVLEAFNAAEALALADRNPAITLMITDVQMPGPVKGFELARLLHERNPAMSIIVCSGLVRPGEGDLPASVRFVDKPLSARVLAQAMAHFSRGEQPGT